MIKKLAKPEDPEEVKVIPFEECSSYCGVHAKVYADEEIDDITF